MRGGKADVVQNVRKLVYAQVRAYISDLRQPHSWNSNSMLDGNYRKTKLNRCRISNFFIIYSALTDV
jgi:hypothetical protein